ncbi:MAG: VanZ family protein [Bacilli bacterium]
MKKPLLMISLIVWIMFIFFNSVQTGTQSSEASGFFTTFFKTLFDGIGWEINPDNLSNLIRKSAHMLEFFVLALLFCFNFIPKFPLKRTIEKALLSSVAVAFVDEIIQLFVEGRSGSIIDVAIDNVGTVLALAMFYVIFRNKKKNRPSSLNN